MEATAAPRSSGVGENVAPPRESDRASLAAYLLSFDWLLRDAATAKEIVRTGLPLWQQILSCLPQPSGRGRLLELGSPPFHITLLLQKLRNYELTLTAGVVDGGRRLQQRVVSRAYGEEYTFDCACFDLEREPFPFPEQSFDAVMWCEVIEHLTENPVFTLHEIHRVLKPGGVLVVSTPNVARVENILRMCMGVNIYDPYHLGAPLRGSRHSREYSLLELTELLEGCGFRIELAEGRDLGHALLQGWWRPIERAARVASRLLPGSHADHLFVRVRKEGPFRWCFPPGIFDQGHLGWYLNIGEPEVVMGANDVPQTGPGWGPLEVGADGKGRRRAGAVSDVYVLAVEGCKTVVIEGAGGDGPSSAEVEVLAGRGYEGKRIATGRVEAEPQRWSRWEIPLPVEVAVGTEIHLRILAPAGLYVHRVALQA